MTRILAVTLAVAGLTFVTAHAQTVGMPGGGNAGSDKTRPDTAPSANPGQIHQPASPASKTRPSGGATSDLNRPTHEQSTGSIAFDPSQYKTQTECLNAASFVSVPFSRCKNLK